MLPPENPFDQNQFPMLHLAFGYQQYVLDMAEVFTKISHGYVGESMALVRKAKEIMASATEKLGFPLAFQQDSVLKHAAECADFCIRLATVARLLADNPDPNFEKHHITRKDLENSLRTGGTTFAENAENILEHVAEYVGRYGNNRPVFDDELKTAASDFFDARHTWAILKDCNADREVSAFIAAAQIAAQDPQENPPSPPSPRPLFFGDNSQESGRGRG